MHSRDSSYRVDIIKALIELKKFNEAEEAAYELLGEAIDANSKNDSAKAYALLATIELEKNNDANASQFALAAQIKNPDSIDAQTVLTTIDLVHLDLSNNKYHNASNPYTQFTSHPGAKKRKLDLDHHEFGISPADKKQKADNTFEIKIPEYNQFKSDFNFNFK